MAVDRVQKTITKGQALVIDLDLRSYFDNVRHHILLEKVAKRVRDPRVLRLLKLILEANGKKGVPQGGVISPLLSNIYLNDVDRMLEKAKGWPTRRSSPRSGPPSRRRRERNGVRSCLATSP
jgi:RNA-directed DNA polymerase